MIGGLVTSTVLTLLVIPAIYKWFAVEVARDTRVLNGNTEPDDEDREKKELLQ